MIAFKVFVCITVLLAVGWCKPTKRNDEDSPPADSGPVVEETIQAETAYTTGGKKKREEDEDTLDALDFLSAAVNAPLDEDSPPADSGPVVEETIQAETAYTTGGKKKREEDDDTLDALDFLSAAVNAPLDDDSPPADSGPVVEETIQAETAYTTGGKRKRDEDSDNLDALNFLADAVLVPGPDEDSPPADSGPVVEETIQAETAYTTGGKRKREEGEDTLDALNFLASVANAPLDGDSPPVDSDPVVEETIQAETAYTTGGKRKREEDEDTLDALNFLADAVNAPLDDDSPPADSGPVVEETIQAETAYTTGGKKKREEDEDTLEALNFLSAVANAPLDDDSPPADSDPVVEETIQAETAYTTGGKRKRDEDEDTLDALNFLADVANAPLDDDSPPADSGPVVEETIQAETAYTTGGKKKREEDEDTLDALNFLSAAVNAPLDDDAQSADNSEPVVEETITKEEAYQTGQRRKRNTT